MDLGIMGDLAVKGKLLKAYSWTSILSCYRGGMPSEWEITLHTHVEIKKQKFFSIVAIVADAQRWVGFK